MKLHYFDIYGRAESVRFLLAHAKAEYENEYVKDMAALKPTLEFGQVPMFEVDGKHLVQSWSILRYLGRQHGYYPQDLETAYLIDSTIDAVEDYFGAYFKFNFESNEEKKAIFKENWLKMFPVFLPAIEKRLEGKKFLTGDELTIGDFALAALGFNLLLNEANPHFAETWPLVKDHEILKKYANNLKEELGGYLASRPQPRPF
jgi:glutathione S-transferase